MSGSTLAAGLAVLDADGIQYEAWAAALYPFMDIPALVTAIVLASIHTSKQKQKQQAVEAATVATFTQQEQKTLVTAGVALSEYAYAGVGSNRGGGSGHTVHGYTEPRSSTTKDKRVKIWPIIQDSLQGSALSALLLGLALGLLTRPESVYESFCEPLFRGFLSILMLVMGMEATARIGELRKVAQWYAVYGFIAPLLHGFIAFGLGMIAHYAIGFSLGGVVLLAVIAASSSDISGPATLRAGIPSANPSAYIGSSTAVGTPVAIALGIPLFIGLAQALGV